MVIFPSVEGRYLKWIHGHHLWSKNPEPAMEHLVGPTGVGQVAQVAQVCPLQSDGGIYMGI